MHPPTGPRKTTLSIGLDWRNSTFGRQGLFGEDPLCEGPFVTALIFWTGYLALDLSGLGRNCFRMNLPARVEARVGHVQFEISSEFVTRTRERCSSACQVRSNPSSDAVGSKSKNGHTFVA